MAELFIKRIMIVGENATIIDINDDRSMTLLEIICAIRDIHSLGDQYLLLSIYSNIHSITLDVDSLRMTPNNTPSIVGYCQPKLG